MSKVFTDQIPPAGGRKYSIAANPDGTSSITDVTQYVQDGTPWGAGDANEVSEHIADTTIHTTQARKNTVDAHIANTTIHTPTNQTIENAMGSAITEAKAKDPVIMRGYEGPISPEKAMAIGLPSGYYILKGYPYGPDGYGYQEARPVSGTTPVIYTRKAVGMTWGAWRVTNPFVQSATPTPATVGNLWVW